jgi:uncharacterized paraquat-inducible protein A
MEKENGRLEPAVKEELAGLKGKEMVCHSCGAKFILTKVQFASATCEVCGKLLSDGEMASAKKLTG